MEGISSGAGGDAAVWPSLARLGVDDGDVGPRRSRTFPGVPSEL